MCQGMLGNQNLRRFCDEMENQQEKGGLDRSCDVSENIMSSPNVVWEGIPRIDLKYEHCM